MVQEIESVVTITDKAAEKAAALLKEKGVETARCASSSSEGLLGLPVRDGDRAGQRRGDIVHTHGGVTVLVDPESAPLMRGAEIDYVDDIMKVGVHYLQPERGEGVRLWIELPDRRRRRPGEELLLVAASLLTRRAPG